MGKVKAVASKTRGASGIAKAFVPACQRQSDIVTIRERLSMVMADKELFKATLVKSGVYDSNLKLTKAYR